MSCLYKQWQTFVPICFTVSDNPIKNLMDNEASRVLMRLLEAYICNGLNSEAVFAKLRELDDPPQLCGKMVKSQESPLTFVG